MHHLPPLNPLRAFEAAGRHESFISAAEELHVTPSAISHQIKPLERFLEVELFWRERRQVSLTPSGARYLFDVRDAFERISSATARLRRSREEGPLTVSAAPSFATGWLVPRLAIFQMTHPTIEIRLVSSIEVTDFHRSDLDVAIRTGNGDRPGLCSHMIICEDTVPVCSPALTRGADALLEPAGPERLTLLQQIPRMGEWRSWLNAAGAPDVESEGGLSFQDGAMAIEAAIAGLGVALASRHVVEHHLNDGRLVIPFDQTLPSENGYYLVYPKSRENEPKITAFREWLMSEISSQGESATGRDGSNA